MNRNEAYSILGLTEAATKEEVKKSFKKLVAQHHPDKSDGNAEMFKKVTEAYQFIKTGKDFGPTQPQQHSNQGYHTYSNGGGFNINLDEILNNMRQNPFHSNARKPRRVVSNKNLNISISFKESVLGCQKNLSFKRNVKCEVCDGQGSKKINNNCTTCGGGGIVTKIQGNIMMKTTCGACRGFSKVEKCIPCNEQGVVEADTSVAINIPGGVHENRNILRLEGIGDYGGEMFGNDQYMAVLLKVDVEPENNLKIEGNDVVTVCTIPLLDALRGAVREVPSVDGLKSIQIPAAAKHLDEIIIPNLGVDRIGNERVILNIEYPNVLAPLIGVLENIKEN